MNNKLTLTTIVFLSLLISCSSENTSLNDVSEDQGSNQEINTSSNPEPEEAKPEPEEAKPELKTEVADIDEVLKEFPQGALSFLSNNEKQCIAEISTTESLKSMEKSLMEEGKILQEQMDYFTSCNLPGPPGIGIKEVASTAATDNVQETSYSTSFASIENIRSLGEDGVSPHLEKVDDKTIRLFYSSIKVKGIAVSLCDYELNCELQGALERMADLTLIETIDGVKS